MTTGYCQECGDADVPVTAARNPGGYGTRTTCRRCVRASEREMAMLREMGRDQDSYDAGRQEHEASCCYCLDGRSGGRAPVGGLSAACLRNRRNQERGAA